jgi:4-alpha-glucanotransferase
MADAASSRRSGVLVPLFAAPSSTSWGIGDIGDLAPLTAWLAGAGQQVLQLLPLNEMAPGQQSPYSAISAMAIDPVYIGLNEVADFAALGGEAALGPSDRALLDRARSAARIDYPVVRRLKHASLRACFDRFLDADWSRDTARARDLRTFLSGQAWWVEDYALFRAIHAQEGERPWTAWPPGLARREPAEIDRARRDLSREVLYYQYLQWLALSQWRTARAAAARVALFGDLPFMVDGDSADVWARQQQFRLDASIGAPPDAFSATGQNWGMPLYRWDVMAIEDFLWLRERARRAADLYDGYRIDHLVGFYRTYAWPHDGSAPFFTPADEPAQTRQGERLLEIFRATGSTIIAEDLGVVPDFVRGSLARLGVSGFRVFRWERRWRLEGQPFIDPRDYPPASVAASGTHDTEPLALWWARASDEDRRSVWAIPTCRQLAASRSILADAPFDPAVRDILLEVLFASGSNLLLLPIQDVFGSTDRINEPATVNELNWTYRLPWPSDRLHAVAEARERQDALRHWAAKYHRL